MQTKQLELTAAEAHCLLSALEDTMRVNREYIETRILMDANKERFIDGLANMSDMVKKLTRLFPELRREEAT